MASVVFLFKQKTAYERLISDWSSDVCSSDLVGTAARPHPRALAAASARRQLPRRGGRAPRLRRRRRRDRLRQFDQRAVLRRLPPRARVRRRPPVRSEESRVGKECVSTCRSRGSPDHSNKKKSTTKQNT